MPIIKFKATHGFPSYHDLPIDFRDGDEREVSDEKAIYLTTTFPEHFSILEKSKEAPGKNRAEKGPGKNR